MSEPKRHHYVPQFYLKNFAEDDRLWVYDIEKGEFRRQAPGRVAFKNYYYSTVDESGNRDNGLERTLAIAEGEAKPAIDALVKGESLSDEQRAEVAFFIALMKSRTPEFEEKFNELNDHFIKSMLRQRYSNVEAAKQAMSEIESATGISQDVMPEELVEFAQRGEFDVVPPRESAIIAFLGSAIDAYQFFVQMDWTVLLADEDARFVTSDDPFTLLPPPDWRPDDGGVGFLTAGALKLFPLSSKACLVMGDYGGDLMFKTARQEEVEFINAATARGAGRLVIGGEKQLLESVVRNSELDNRTATPRWRFSSPGAAEDVPE